MLGMIKLNKRRLKEIFGFISISVQLGHVFLLSNNVLHNNVKNYSKHYDSIMTGKEGKKSVYYTSAKETFYRVTYIFCVRVKPYYVLRLVV